MIDFDKLAEMSFLIFVMDQKLLLDGGIVLDRDNFAEFMSFQFNA